MDLFPTKGRTGKAEVRPMKAHEIMKQGPLPEGKPKFIRDSMNIDDINGTRSKRLYRSKPREI